MKSEAVVWVDPGRCSGQPCINGTRIRTELAARTVWANGMTEALLWWPHLSAEQIRGACWYEAVHGSTKWRKRWADWTDIWAHQMWRGAWQDVPNPPTKSDREKQP